MNDRQKATPNSKIISPDISPFSKSITKYLSPIENYRPFIDPEGPKICTPKNLCKVLNSPFPLYKGTQLEFTEKPPELKKRPPKRKTHLKRTSCNCQKSQCLKLYCDCFAAGTYCDQCNCVNCQNTQDHELARTESISATLERNPDAFKPKIERSNGEAQHNRGCNCTRSACLKKYCECFESHVKCTAICNCTGCKNRD